MRCDVVMGIEKFSSWLHRNKSVWCMTLPLIFLVYLKLSFFFECSIKDILSLSFEVQDPFSFASFRPKTLDRTVHLVRFHIYLSSIM